ncbi:MAG TPA: hypothetical protein VF676_10565 [Flavobacterium sp.]|jgi:hypothetical protein
MKTIHYLSLGILLFLSSVSTAQVSAYPDLNLEANTILQHEMATDIRYYYYPNLQAYFDTKTLTYLYSKNREWVESTRIPSGHMGYSVYNTTKVALTDYLGDTPYEMIEDHKKQYPPQYIAKRQAPPKQQKADESTLAYN